MRIIQMVLAAMLLFVVATIAAFVYLRWWQALLVVVAMILLLVIGVRLLIRNVGKIIGRSMLKLFEVKSVVLRGADTEVHAVEPTTAPPGDEGVVGGEDEGGKVVNFYRIDVTIKPRPPSGPMKFWDLDDLRLVPFDTPAATLAKIADEGAENIEGYWLRDVKIMDGERCVDADQGKYDGPRQIRAVVAVPPHVRELKFQYYAEQFGRIQLPPPLPLLT